MLKKWLLFLTLNSLNFQIIIDNISQTYYSTIPTMFNQLFCLSFHLFTLNNVSHCFLSSHVTKAEAKFTGAVCFPNSEGRSFNEAVNDFLESSSKVFFEIEKNSMYPHTCLGHAKRWVCSLFDWKDWKDWKKQTIFLLFRHLLCSLIDVDIQYCSYHHLL